jgi:hypothetical protein
MEQMNRSRFDKFVNRAVKIYREVLRLTTHPSSIRIAVTALGTFDAIKLSLVLHDLSFAGFVIALYIACRNAQARLPRHFGALRLVTLFAANYCYGFIFVQEHHLSEVCAKLTGVSVPSFALAALVAIVPAAAEAFADYNHQRRGTEELVGYSQFVKAEPEDFTFFNPREGYVVIRVTGVYDGAQPRRFGVEVRDIDQKKLAGLLQIGRQASGRVYCPAGLVRIYVYNYTYFISTLTVTCSATIEVPRRNSGSRSEPLIIHAFEKPLPEPPAEAGQLSQVICPAGARAATPPPHDVEDGSDAVEPTNGDELKSILMGSKQAEKLEKKRLILEALMTWSVFLEQTLRIKRNRR